MTGTATQAKIVRLAKAVQAAGLKPTEAEILPDGTIRLRFLEGAATPSPSDDPHREFLGDAD